MITIARLASKNQVAQFNYALACVAKIKEVQFFYFTPEDVDFTNKKIEGTYYNGEKWTRKKFDYPDYIYDRLLTRGRKHLEMYEEFSNIPFNNEKRVGGSMNKARMYKLIEKGKQFKDYLIPYKSVQSINDITNFFNQSLKVICKSETGSLGRNVFYFEKIDNQYKVKLQKEEFLFTEDEFLQYVQREIIDARAKFVVQPFIKSKTNAGNPFDVRAHLMKGADGTWKIAKIYPRIGVKGTVISNLHLGGSTCELKIFLNKHISVGNVNQFRRKLRRFSLDFANHIEQQFDFHFSELGLDIAIDENEKIWLFEVNMNQINVSNLRLEAAELAIAYGKHVVLQSQLEPVQF